MNDQQALQSREPLWTSSFILLTLSYLLLFLCLQMLLSPFPSYVKDRFHPSDFTVSLVTSLFALTAIATRFLTVYLMKRISRTRILYAGIGIAAAATAAYSFADTVVGVLLLRILFGIGFGIGSTVMPTLVTQLIPKRRLGEGIGYFGLSTSLAMSIGPMIGLTVLKTYGFPMLTGCGVAAALLIVPLLASARPHTIPVPAGKPFSEEPGAARKPLMLRPKLLFPALLNTLLSASYGGLLSFLALYGKEIHLENIGLFFLFNSITVLAVRPLSGRLFDQRGHGVVLIPAAIILVASLSILSITTTLPMLMLSALLYGLGYGAVQPTIQAWMLQECGPREHGAVNSLFYNSLDFGIAAGSMVLGAVASASSYAVMYRFAAGFMVLFLISYLLLRRMARSKKL
jgi:MFS family permease